MSRTRSFLANACRRTPVVVVFSVAAVVSYALAAASSFAQTSGGAEWPQFQGGPEHRGVSESGPAPPYRTRWTFTSPDGSGLSGAVIVDGLAISVGRASVYAVDVATGELAWDVARADGPVSSPAIASGRRLTLLYVDGGASTTPSPSPPPTEGSPSPSSDEEGEAVGASLVAIGLEDQAEVWRVPLGAESRSGVTVDGQVAYVGDQDGTLYAVDVADGTVRWTSEMPGRIDISIAASDGRAVAISRDDDSRRVVVAAYDADDGERRGRGRGVRGGHRRRAVSARSRGRRSWMELPVQRGRRAQFARDHRSLGAARAQRWPTGGRGRGVRSTQLAECPVGGAGRHDRRLVRGDRGGEGRQRPGTRRVRERPRWPTHRRAVAHRARGGHDADSYRGRPRHRARRGARPRRPDPPPHG